jgi:probable HAF family extracellular repeat protein
MVDLGTLGGHSSAALAINDHGQVVGTADIAGQNINHAFLYENGHMIDLGTLYGSFSYAIAINASTQILGDSAAKGNLFPYGERVPFLYQNGSMVPLNDLIDPRSGWFLNSANAINDRGWIVGAGTNPLGENHAFLLTPVPEPNALGFLFVLTLVGRRLKLRDK